MNFKQIHPETCLSRSLLILAHFNGKKTFEKDELDIFIYSLKHNRENFTVGHIKRFTEKFNLKVNWYSDTKIYFNFMKKQKLPKNANLILQQLSLAFLEGLTKNGPVIIYLDKFYLCERGTPLYYKYHWPHFVVLLEKNKGKYLIIDPDDGKKHFIEPKRLQMAITELKKRLWLCPQAIQIK